MRLRCCTLFILFVVGELYAQGKINFVKAVQFSVAPGISTNGLHPGGYSNYISFNLTSGYSAASYLFETAILSNLNVCNTRGLQVAGLVNVTGGNAFAGLQYKEMEQKRKTGFEANVSGVQLAGAANIVLNHVYGWQTAGLFNVVKGALTGFQLAGLSNNVHQYSFGLQLAGLWNTSVESMDGVQVAALFNVTKGGLYGVQLSAFNLAGFIEGKNSYDNRDPTGLQLGLLNQAKKMNGFQVGLVNVSKRMQGTQIGLINIYRGGTIAETRDGTSIGLVNLGSSGYLSFYSNEMFLTNLALSTGTVKNRRVKSDRTEIHIQNALLFSNRPLFIKGSEEACALGYGLKKFHFNRSTFPGMGNLRFFSYGMDVQHINHQRKKITTDRSLLMRPTVMVGTRLHPKLSLVYVFTALSYNFYWTDTDQSLAPSMLKTSWSLSQGMVESWLGFSLGIHLQG